MLIIKLSSSSTARRRLCTSGTKPPKKPNSCKNVSFQTHYCVYWLLPWTTVSRMVLSASFIFVTAFGSQFSGLVRFSLTLVHCWFTVLCHLCFHEMAKHCITIWWSHLIARWAGQVDRQAHVDRSQDLANLHFALKNACLQNRLRGRGLVWQRLEPARERQMAEEVPQEKIVHISSSLFGMLHLKQASSGYIWEGSEEEKMPFVNLLIS